MKRSNSDIEFCLPSNSPRSKTSPPPLQNLLASFISREHSALSSIQVLSSVNRSRHDEVSKLALSTSDPAIVAAALRMRVPKKVREKLLLDNYDDKTIRQTVFATWKGESKELSRGWGGGGVSLSLVVILVL